jgi:hypothetical protein
MAHISHFCDPERNHFEVDHWPRHESCNGKELINFGLGNEQIVVCECPCHLLPAWAKRSERRRNE